STVQRRIQLGAHIVAPGPPMRQTHRARRRERQQLGTQHITEPIERIRLTIVLCIDRRAWTRCFRRLRTGPTGRYPQVTYGSVGYARVGKRLQKGRIMAITDVEEFAHLTDADIESLGVELDAIRQDFEDARGERDSRYIHRTIAAQRALEAAGRVMLAASSRRSAWWAGTVTLGVAKIVENMEIGHNVMHGQWDWMNDPEIHSTTWEWDMSGAS